MSSYSPLERIYYVNVAPTPVKEGSAIIGNTKIEINPSIKGAAKGAVGGAIAGSYFGPVGSAVGAAIGGTIGLIFGPDD